MFVIILFLSFSKSSLDILYDQRYGLTNFGISAFIQTLWHLYSQFSRGIGNKNPNNKTPKTESQTCRGFMSFFKKIQLQQNFTYRRRRRHCCRRRRRRRHRRRHRRVHQHLLRESAVMSS